MQLRSDIQLSTLIQAMTNVIIPAIDSENQLAQEQAQLMVGMLQLMSCQLPLQYRFDRDELTRLIEYSEQLVNTGSQCALSGNVKADFEQLAKRSDDSQRLLQRCDADPAELHIAVRQLREDISQVVKSVSSKGDIDLIGHVENIVLELSRDQLVRDRALLVVQGWEPDPEALPDINELLNGV
jgi:hypothetical protein